HDAQGAHAHILNDIVRGGVAMPPAHPVAPTSSGSPGSDAWSTFPAFAQLERIARGLSRLDGQAAGDVVPPRRAVLLCWVFGSAFQPGGHFADRHPADTERPVGLDRDSEGLSPFDRGEPDN